MGTTSTSSLAQSRGMRTTRDTRLQNRSQGSRSKGTRVTSAMPTKRSRELASCFNLGASSIAAIEANDA